MRKIAERYIQEAAREGDPLPTIKGIKAKLASLSKYRCTAGFGAVSIAFIYPLIFL